MIESLSDYLSVLDPRITYAELEADYKGDLELTERLQRSEVPLQDLFNKNYARRDPGPPPLEAIPSSRSASSSYMLPIPSRSLDTPTYDFTARFQRLACQQSLKRA